MKRADRNWTADKLAGYCKRALGREASDAWCLGEAFELAKAKVGHGKWDAWRKKHHFSASMTERYIKLHKAATLAQVADMTLTQACRRFGVHINGAKTIPQIGEPAWSVEKQAVSADEVASSGDLNSMAERMQVQLIKQKANAPADIAAAIDKVLAALGKLQTTLQWADAMEGLLIAS